MKWIIPIISIVIIFSLIFIGAKHVVDNATKIASASEIMPTPTTVKASQEALDLAALIIANSSDTDKTSAKEQNGNKDMSDEELINDIATKISSDPTLLAKARAEKERIEAQANKPQVIYKTNTVTQTQYVPSPVNTSNQDQINQQNQTQQKLNDIQQQQQQIENQQRDAEERDRMNCMDNGGLYSSVSGCN